MKARKIPRIALALLCAQSVHAGATDLSNAPLFTSSISAVKSNVLFILDNSGSMQDAYLPDDVPQAGKYGYYSPQCNGVQYNPAINYVVPVKYDGTLYPSASFISAYSDGYSRAGTPISLAGQYYYKYTGAQTPMSYTYTSTGVVTTSSFYRECNSNEPTVQNGVTTYSTPGSNVFTKVVMSATSTDAQNYANWYSYYHTRMLMMKTSVGLAFAAVDSRYRIGFNVISNSSLGANTTSFVNVSDFSAAQKELFYTTLYAASGNSNTPLRGALSRAGQYFAHKAPGQTVDPVQYSCQKNFTILSTDGYWNTGTEVTGSNASTNYSSYQLDNLTLVGEQDGAASRPLWDGSSTTQVTTRKWNVTSSGVDTSTVPITNVSKATSTTTTTYSGAGLTRNSYSPTTLTLATGVGGSIFSFACTTSVSGNCTVATINTNNPHGLSTGNTVTISGAVPATYNGTFSITRTGSKSFTYVPTSGTAVATITAKGTAASGSCPVGKAALTTQAQTGTTTQTQVGATAINTTVTSSKYQTRNTSAVTSYTETITTINGSLFSDSTTSASPVITLGAYSAFSTPVISSTVVGSSYVVSTGSITPSTPTPVWVASGAATTACAASVPSPNPSAQSGTNIITTSSSTPAPVVTDPGDVLGTAVLTSSVPSVVTGPVTTVVGTAVTSGGSSNSLADIAMYYYATDLRNTSLNNCTGALGSGSDVCANNVAGVGRDSATYQHMTTFTLGLGNSGTLKYDPNYLTQASGDYFDISQGTKNWPLPQSTTSGGGPENIDDLWHAAVDGRGQYFAASEPQALSSSLNSALDSIKAISGSASAAATSSLQPVTGNNNIYVAQFTSQKWTGDVLSFTIDPTSGAVSTAATWSAQAQLDAMVASATPRTIYYPQAGALTSFTYAHLSQGGWQAYFDNFCNKAGAGGTLKPTQCLGLNSSDLALANGGANLVDYLRGTTSYTVYRARDHVLGDIINASPLFVSKPSFRYTENGYGSFASSSTRSDVIYAASNDGMLHAIDRTTGNEKWAYIPSFVLPQLYKLADANYPNNHMYLVDGSPIMGDIYTSTGWKTILVGGLNAGGRGYYALDVTNPQAPLLLWEFSATDLGYSFGNPVITKLSNGTWVVMFSSGYNNINAGDGNGHLYVLDANTGGTLTSMKLDTNIAASPVGSNASPSGLAKINAYITSDLDNTAQFVYGGDLLGNVWRFDINASITATPSAMLLAKLAITSGGVATPQPITSKPALAEVDYLGNKYRVVYVGTGEYLGGSDLSTKGTQTIYALKDSLTVTGIGDARTAMASTIPPSPALVVQLASAATSATQGNILTGTANFVDWGIRSGWYMDLINSGERVSVNPSLVLNTLYVGTNVPSVDACTVGGTSWLYRLDIGSGAALPNATDNAIAVSLGNILIMGMTTVQTTDGHLATIITRSDGTLASVLGDTPPLVGALRRTSWRVLK